MKICCWLHHCISSSRLIQQNGVMGKQGHKLYLQDQTHWFSSTQPWCWPCTYFFLVSLWTQGNQFLWCASHVTCCATWQSPYLQWHLSTDHLEMPGSLPSLPWICGLLVARLSHLKIYTWELEIRTLVMATLSERQRYMTFFPCYWRNPDRHDGEQESNCSVTFEHKGYL